jgi:HEAT repeat protein
VSIPEDEGVKAALPELLARLTDDDFDAREAAFKKLAALGESAEPAFAKAMDGDRPVEVKERIRQILRTFADEPARPDSETLRRIRAIQALGLVRSAEALGVIETIAKGVRSRVAREALMTLKLLKVRAP